MSIVAVERLKRLELRLGGRLSHPLDGLIMNIKDDDDSDNEHDDDEHDDDYDDEHDDDLPRRDEPHIVHGGDCVQEQLKTLLVVRRCEPGCIFSS